MNFLRFIRINAPCIVSALLLTLSCLCAAAFLSRISFSSDAASSHISEGLNVLSADEMNDPSEADDFFRAKLKERSYTGLSKTELAALKDDILNERIDVYSLFKDYVILGDSRALGFSHFRFLDYSRVIAGGGDTIYKVREHMDTIKKLNPTHIYLCYGINDAGMKIGKTPDGYAKEVHAVIEELQQALPDARIYFSSIIWISEQAAINCPPWEKIYDFNISCKAMCEEYGLRYIDNDEICQQLKEEKWWSGDGVHLSKSFYKLWAQNLYLATLEG